MVELNFRAGDYVRIRGALKEIDGTVLENPEPGFLLLKLKSGYNIGILKENILAARILKKFQEQEAKEKTSLKKNKDLPSIGLVVTGGTIAAKLDSRTGGVHWLTDVNEFQRFYPELFEMANVKKIVVPFMTAS